MMEHWHCESRGYLESAVYPRQPAVPLFEFDNPDGYQMNTEEQKAKVIEATEKLWNTDVNGNLKVTGLRTKKQIGW